MNHTQMEERQLLDRNEQVQYYSASEYLRRKEAAIAEMRKKDVSLLLIANPCEEGFGLYFAGDTRCSYILISAEGDLILVYGYALSGNGSSSVLEERRIDAREFPALMPGLSYTGGLDVSYIAAHAEKGRQSASDRKSL